MKSATALSVNLNKIALLRNAREGDQPSVIDHAKLCIETGVQGITVHPRPDLRHIRPDDVADLKALCNQHPEIELNIEGNPFSEASDIYPGFMALVAEYPPAQCTMVPDSTHQLTSDHGFDLRQSADVLVPVIDKLKSLNCRISLFMDPDPEQIRLAAKLGVDRVELYTGPYANIFAQGDAAALQSALCLYSQAAKTARELGLGVNAGHDLNLKNLPALLASMDIDEVSIGHALIVDALEMGMKLCLEAYLNSCRVS